MPMMKIFIKPVEVITHSRTVFYHGKKIYWYEFPKWCRIINYTKFLRVLNTDFYEYGGTHQEALKDLRAGGFKIKKGKPI